jgi:circadian clock protein KaiC
MSSGVPELDQMLGGKGFYRGSTVLLSGTAGTGKSSLAAHLAEATCRHGQRCMFFSFEESPGQILRNMRTIGINLEPHVRRGLLQFHSARPTVHGLEMHLVRMHKLVADFDPEVVIVDPISNLRSAGTADDSTNMLIRLIDYLRIKNILAFFVSLTGGAKALESTDEGMSSMVDTWLLLRDIEVGGERNRLMYVLKARGMAHSNQVREFLITSRGAKLIPAYLGTEGVLTGSARISQEMRERVREALVRDEIEGKKVTLRRRGKAIEAQIAALRAEYEAEAEELARIARNQTRNDERSRSDQLAMGRSRSNQRNSRLLKP